VTVTIAEMREKRPKAFRIYTLRRQGLMWPVIAQKLGIKPESAAVIGNMVARLLRESSACLADKYPDKDVHVPRCKCGLMLPCDGCTGRAETYLRQQDSGPANGWRTGVKSTGT
jgi:hypothetical protein